MTGALVRRLNAAQRTLDVWSRRPLKLGTADCVRMAAAHLRLLGYRVKLPPSGSYRTVNSARKALAKMGHDLVAAALDAMGLERIAPAAAIVGDLVMLPSEDGLGGLAVSLGNGRLAGWHPDAPGGAVVCQPVEFVTAWRVEPK